jgi:hypothetical protein
VEIGTNARYQDFYDILRQAVMEKIIPTWSTPEVFTVPEGVRYYMPRAVRIFLVDKEVTEGELRCMSALVGRGIERPIDCLLPLLTWEGVHQDVTIEQFEELFAVYHLLIIPVIHTEDNYASVRRKHWELNGVRIGFQVAVQKITRVVQWSAREDKQDWIQHVGSYAHWSIVRRPHCRSKEGPMKSKASLGVVHAIATDFITSRS